MTLIRGVVAKCVVFNSVLCNYFRGRTTSHNFALQQPKFKFDLTGDIVLFLKWLSKLHHFSKASLGMIHGDC